jgi:hypothetical protein
MPTNSISALMAAVSTPLWQDHRGVKVWPRPLLDGHQHASLEREALVSAIDAQSALPVLSVFFL